MKVDVGNSRHGWGHRSPSVVRGRKPVVAALIALLAVLLPGVPASSTVIEHDVVVGDVPVNWSPHVLDGKVTAIIEVGSRVVVGGTFTQYRNANGSGQVDNRPYLFAFDRSTGTIDTAFDPVLDDAVEALAPGPDGQSVFVGGRFRTVDGVEHRNLVKLSLATGDPITSFQATPNRKVWDLKVKGDRLYVSGTFTEVSGEPRTVVAAVDPGSGAVDPDVDLEFTGAYGGRDGVGTLAVQKIDVTPDGTRLVAIGNFSEVDGNRRHQVALIDTAARPARVADWHTERFRQDLCNPVFDTYMRNVDISPDGSHMVIVTTGAYRSPPRLCDTASRWDLGVTGSDLDPTWVNYAGGDTFYGVATTGEAVYVGGHQRWMNNPFAGDAPGPGAVPRDGLAGLDPRNGMPLTWDPGRTRGVGVFDMEAVEDGIWMGSDTEYWNWFLRPRLAKFPTNHWSSDGPVPPADPGPIPGEVFRAPTGLAERDPAYVHRVNAGGPMIAASDYGKDWEADTSSSSPYRNSGSNAASWSAVPTTDDTVPDTAPSDLFSSERWDPGSGEEMQWDFPVEAGRDLEVRLYLANRCTCTDNVGEREFDVTLEGDLVLDDYDIVADVGDDVGTMKAFQVVSDGNVDIDFGHVTENPLINGIEIVDLDLLGQFEPPPGIPMERRDFDGTSFGPMTEVGDGSTDWSRIRGAFMLSGQLYYGGVDGALYQRSLNGTTFGEPQDLELYDLTSSHFPIANLTGMTFDPISGRLYYTVSGQARLYSRFFEPESGIVGAETFQVAGNLSDLDWRDVAGMHLDVDSETLYVGSTDDNLRAVSFVDGAPVSGSAGVVAGPAADDGTTWASRGLFTYAAPGYDAPNRAPVPQVSVACDGLSCTFGSTGSHDPDGVVEGFSWALPGGTADGAGATHTFPSEGVYDVTLTVTDDEGASTSTTTAVSVAQPVADLQVSCVDLTCQFDGTGSADVAGPIVDHAWTFGDGDTASGATAEHTYASAGAKDVSLTVTDDEGDAHTVERTIRVDTAPTQIALLGTSSGNANTEGIEVRVPGTVRGGDGLLLFVSVNRTSTGTAAPSGSVDGWEQLDTIVAGNLRTTVWHKVAQTGDEGRAVTVNFDGWTKADVSLAAYEGTSVGSPVAVFEGLAETSYQAEHTTPALANPADDAWVVSYWADRTSSTSDWVEPAGQTVRHEAFGPGPGHVSALLTDTDGGVAAGGVGGLTAVANESNDDATMWTVVLPPRGFDAGAARPPTPVVNSSCDGLVCTFDGSASTDDGTITDHAWSFSDGGTASGAVVEHEFSSEGTAEATLTVTDDEGLTATETESVDLSSAPTARIDVTCTDLQCTFDGSASSDVSGTIASWDWSFGDGGSDTGAVAEHTYAEGGTYTTTLTVTDDEGETGTDTVDVTVATAATEITFVGASGTTGNTTNASVTVPDGVVAGDTLLLFASVNNASTVVGPPTGTDGAWTTLDEVTAGSMATHAWALVAGPSEAGSEIAVPFDSRVKHDVVLAAYTGTDDTAPVHAFAAAAETVYRAEHTTPEVTSTVEGAWEVSYWADKTSGTTAWTAPSSTTVRHEGYGAGGGRISGLLADRGPVAAGTLGGLVATADETNQKATMWTVVLAPG